MQDLPHRYELRAQGGPEGNVVLSAKGLPSLDTAPPVEFEGPGDRWFPESLLLAAVADCYVLAFRILAENSSLAWTELACRAEGVVDRADGAMRFTQIRLRAELDLPAGQKRDRAERLLERAKKQCVVSNSLATPVELETEIREAA